MLNVKLLFLVAVFFSATAHASWAFLDSLTCNGQNGLKIATTGPVSGGILLPVSMERGSQIIGTYATWTTENGGVGISGKANAVELSDNSLALGYVLVFDRKPIDTKISDSQIVRGTLYRRENTLFLTTVNVPITKVNCQLRLTAH